ncbi:M36 family metallopeptidase [Flavobacteriales bacterium]|nr:M36 family metallopeptidase [Flavobacteriales bacterium]
MTISRIAITGTLTLLLNMSGFGQISTPSFHFDPSEVRMPATWSQPQEGVQAMRRSGPFWSSYSAEHPRWQVQFHPATGTVHRAYGPAIPVANPTSWLEGQLEAAGWQVSSSNWTATTMGKHTLYRAEQTADGRPILGTELVVKLADQGVVMWGAQCFPQAAWPAELVVLQNQDVVAAATEGLTLTELSTELGGESLIPWRHRLEEQWTVKFRPARSIELKGFSADGIPVQYATWIDLETGEVLERINQVHHLGHSKGKGEEPAPRPMGPAALMQMLSCQVTGTVHLTQPFEATTEVGLANLEVSNGGGTQYTDAGGMLNFEAPGSQDLSIQLQGLWSTVTSDGVTPQLELTVEGDSVVSFDNNATIRELSAYHNVNRIHDHMQQWLPGFTGLDFSMPTVVDVSGTCNAFYTPGSPSINFYSEGDGCNAFSMVSDVVFHEYGHGINDLYYEGLGSGFNNGAMNEGYADWWAISLTDNPVLGAGCYSDNPEFYIRRYDVNPKVYPQDLVGEVHADGEIICGAWYDTHLLLGADWEVSMGLFTDIFDGQQATTANGNEGEAFVEVLLDALQADDDNADLSDGTPNGAAILEGFGMHGITLFSNVEVEHQAEGYTAADENIVIGANAQVLFPFSQYFGSCELYYRTSSNDDWTSMTMDAGEGSDFTAMIPAQTEGTVVEYHFGITDIYGSVSAINPYSANDLDNPNLPFNTIVGLTPVLIDDQDDYSDFGFWQIGLPEDNATTGQWESTIPVGSYSNPGDPSTICAPSEDHTPGDGIFAFITGVSPGADAGIGSNDVDAGSTTLQSEPIDLSEMVSPVLSYWRWYTNAPASGANPGADWWQVYVSSDGGNSWVEIEETLTQDISWRRHAFAIADFVPLTDAFQIKFTASDSLRPDQGLEFDGGSLIEAGLDDLIIHDVATSSVSETRPGAGILAWPVPFAQQLHAAGWQQGAQVQLLDATGRTMAKSTANAKGEVHMTVEPGASGTYVLTGNGSDGKVRRKELVRLGH